MKIYIGIGIGGIDAKLVESIVVIIQFSDSSLQKIQ